MSEYYSRNSSTLRNFSSFDSRCYLDLSLDLLLRTRQEKLYKRYNKRKETDWRNHDFFESKILKDTVTKWIWHGTKNFSILGNCSRELILQLTSCLKLLECIEKSWMISGQQIKRFGKYLDEGLSSFHFLKECRPKSHEISQACDLSRVWKTVCSPETTHASIQFSDHLLSNQISHDQNISDDLSKIIELIIER